jgi:uncharacterized membrane protein YcaP (DUF421 family)
MDVLFDGFTPLLRLVAVGTLAYLGLVVVLRSSGKRTLSKMNAFDLVVTVALGSTLATVLLSSTVSLVEGLAAMALLAGLQFVVAWASVRSPRVARLVRSEPRLLFHDGAYLWEAMRAERVTREEILQAMRDSGVIRVEGVVAVVLETDGSLNVLRGEQEERSTLVDVS